MRLLGIFSHIFRCTVVCVVIRVKIQKTQPLTYRPKDFDRILAKRTYAAGKGSKTGEEFPKGINEEEFKSTQAKENVYKRPDPQLKIELFSSNPYRDVF